MSYLLATRMSEGTPWGVLIFLIVVVSFVVCTVFLWTENGRRSVVGRFLGFENLYIDAVFKTLYVFCVVFVTVLSLYAIYFLASYGTFAGAVVSGLIFFVVAQFVLRLLFEFGMAFVRLAVDVHDVRNALTGGSDPVVSDSALNRGDVNLRGAAASMASLASVAASGVSNLASKGADHAKKYAEAHKATQWEELDVNGAQGACFSHEPVSPESASGSDAGWSCACGADGNVGEFCGFCGSPRP